MQRATPAVAARALGRKSAVPAPPVRRVPVGNQALSRFASGLVLQRRLAISQPGDVFEQEADRVADQVMRMPEPAVQRSCAGCAAGAPCDECADEDPHLMRRAASADAVGPTAPPGVMQGLGAGQPLDSGARAYFEPRFGADFTRVRVHTGTAADTSARSVNALAFAVGGDVVFGAGQYAPGTSAGRRLLAHELTHVLQQRGAPEPSIQRRAAPYIKKVTVHLTPAPLQSADLEWEGTPPAAATGSDHFAVSTGKGYDNPGDPPGTCTRHCCTDPDTQCAPPWNRPGRVGACCTYYGDSFWTGTPQDEHNGWKWWTPIQPYYSQRGIALHQHTEVTGHPIGHGCVRMEEPNAKRIYDYSNGRRTNVTIDGRAAPVACDPSRRCGTSGAGAALGGDEATRVAASEPVPGREGEMT